MTRHEAIVKLESFVLDESLGLGGYVASAAYKLANGDVTPEMLRHLVSDATIDAIADAPIDWDETAYNPANWLS